MKKVCLLLLLYIVPAFAGDKEFYDINEEETSWQPSSIRVKDYVGWWGLTATAAYGMHWGIKNGYCEPKLDTLGRIGLATLAGACGIYIASGAREYIQDQAYFSCGESVKKHTMAKLFCKIAHQKDFKTGKVLIGTLAAVLLTSWSIVYNPFGFKCIDCVVSNRRTNILTGVILPVALNTCAAEGMQYCLKTMFK